MNTYLKVGLATWIATLLLTAPLLFAQPQEQHGFARFKDPIVKHATRACLYPPGGWAIIDCSNASAATSASLNAWSRYIIQCGDDSYIATGTVVGVNADNSDGWLPSGAWLEFMTEGPGGVRFISCLNKNVDSDCRIWECK